MKHNIFKRFSLVAVLLFSAATASAHDFELNGIYYNKNDDGTTVSVTYRGDYYDSYDEYSSSVTIPSEITQEGTTYSVTTIGDYAFRECSGLTSVTIPNSVTSIGMYAFYRCSGLTSVTIPKSVTSIGDAAFEDCSGLTRVDISSIEAWVGIKFDNWSNPLYYAHHLYLNGEEVKDLVIPNSVTSIGDYAFWGCSGLTSVSIPNSVTSIGDYAFSECSGLTSISIPNSVNSIGYCAFYCCRELTSVSIGNSITSIAHYAFEGCNRVTNIFFNGINCNDVKFNDYVFDSHKENLSIIIGKDVKKMPNYLFYILCSGTGDFSIGYTSHLR